MNRGKGMKSRMMARLLKDKEHAGVFVMDIVIGILCVVFVFALWFMIAQFAMDGSISYSEDSFYYNMRSDNYDSIMRMSRTNRINGKNRGANYQEYYALADYYEAALYYRIYTEAGDESRAEIRKQEMEDAVGRMGGLSPQKQKIDEILNKKQGK